MCAEDLPLTHAEALHYCPAFLRAKLWIGVHRRHQNRRVLVIGRLFPRQAVGIHVYIASERDMVGEIDQHGLALKMAAGTLINAQRARLPESLLSADLPPLPEDEPAPDAPEAPAPAAKAPRFRVYDTGVGRLLQDADQLAAGLQPRHPLEPSSGAGCRALQSRPQPLRRQRH